MKAALISIRPEWCRLIVDGKKTIEVRKTHPKLETPFKCYIYCTYGQGLIERYDTDYPNMLIDQTVSKNAIWGNCCNGKVIGEFICTEVRPYAWMRYEFPFDDNGEYYIPESDLKSSCLTYRQLDDYGDGEPLFGWRISDLVIYPKLMELNEFTPVCKFKQDDGTCPTRRIACSYQSIDYNQDGSVNLVECGRRVARAPQSWCYVEEV